MWSFLSKKQHLNYLPKNLQDLNERIKKYLAEKAEEKDKIIRRIKELESAIKADRSKIEEKNQEDKKQQAELEKKIKELEGQHGSSSAQLKKELKERIRNLKQQHKVNFEKFKKQQEELERKQEQETKKREVEMKKIQNDLEKIKKEQVSKALKDHEVSVYGDLRNNFMKSLSQGAETVDKILPFGGKIIGAGITLPLTVAGGVLSWLYYILHGKK